MKTGKDIKKNIEWIRKNSHKYHGVWVALKNGILLGHDHNRKNLHDLLNESGELQGTLFFKA